LIKTLKDKTPKISRFISEFHLAVTFFLSAGCVPTLGVPVVLCGETAAVRAAFEKKKTTLFCGSEKPTKGDDSEIIPKKCDFCCLIDKTVFHTPEMGNGWSV